MFKKAFWVKWVLPSQVLQTLGMCRCMSLKKVHLVHTHRNVGDLRTRRRHTHTLENSLHKGLGAWSNLKDPRLQNMRSAGFDAQAALNCSSFLDI